MERSDFTIVTLPIDHKDQKFLTLLWTCGIRNSPFLTLKLKIVLLWLLPAHLKSFRGPSVICPVSGADWDLLPAARLQQLGLPSLCLWPSDDLWPRFVTYTDNMSGMKTRAAPWSHLAGLSSGYWARFVWRCVFISTSPGHPYSQIPTELRLFFVSARWPFPPPSSPTWLAHQAGQWVVACTQPLPRSLYQCPVIKMSPFNFQAIAFPSAESSLQ